MTEQEQKKLKEQILMLCEKQYRKGLVHGAKLIKNNELSQTTIEMFREFGGMESYKKCQNPIDLEPLDQKFIIYNELGMAGMTELRKFLNL